MQFSFYLDRIVTADHGGFSLERNEGMSL